MNRFCCVARACGHRQNGGQRLKQSASHTDASDHPLAQARIQPLTPDADAPQVVRQAQQIKQPDDNSDDNNNIEDILDFAIHRDVVVDKPQQHSNNNQCNDQ
ncbi:hypothetical protein KBY97_12215 [Synechococcus sp. ATX 2A4]|nr:hypothetical protein [Synechococcus sp. ATX 2A4]